MDILHENVWWQDVYRSVSFIKQLSRYELPGGGRKLRPQKHCGRARIGDNRAPHLVGGGFTHGLKGPRTRFYMLPDAARIKGLCIALTIKHIQDDLVVIDRFDTLPSDDPQLLLQIAEHRNWGYSILFVDVEDEAPRNLCLATTDITSLNIIPVYSLNPMCMLRHDTLVMTKRAIEELQQKLLSQMNRSLSFQTPYWYRDWMTLNTDEDDQEDELEGGTPFI